VFLTGVMWTDKYAPCRANEVIGNWASCRRLRDWLMQWKHMIDRFEKASRQGASKQHRRNDGSGISDGMFIIAIYFYHHHHHHHPRISSRRKF